MLSDAITLETLPVGWAFDASAEAPLLISD
jgi:hypothetical protein